MDETDEIFSSIVEAEGIEEDTLDEAPNNSDDDNDSENADVSITSCFAPVEETTLVLAETMVPMDDTEVPMKSTEVPIEAAEAEEEDWYDEEWTCGNCPKRFAAEKFLLSHHANKHKEL